MKYLKPILGASALALLVSAPAAWADVSAKEVWAQWQDYAARSGLTISSTGESVSGKTTTHSGVKLSVETPEIAYVADVGEIALTENGDGSVTIETPASYPVTVSFLTEDNLQANLEVSQEGLVLVAAGSADAISYAYQAESFTLELLGVTGGDSGATATGALKLGKTEGSSTIGGGELQPFSSEFKSASLTGSVNVEAPEENGHFVMDFTAQDLAAASEGALPKGANPEDLGAMLRAGMTALGKLTSGPATYSVDFEDDEKAFALSSTVDSAGLDFDLTSDGIRYKTEGKGIGLTLSSSDLPLGEVSLSLAETAFGFGMPITKSAEPQDFSFLTRIIGLELDEALLGMFDPEQQIPRSPINVILDLAGKANWLVDITNPEVAEDLGEVAMPGEVHALDINELELTVAGASLTGAGAFTFDNQDLDSWGGIPAPDGKIDLQLVGANKLIDTLVAMGFVPEDQAMMARMSMGMFAKPGQGEDTLVSTIEVKKDGSIFANGMQLQ